MSNLEYDAAHAQLESLVSGVAEKTYATAKEVAFDLAKLSQRSKQLFEDARSFYNASMKFVTQQNPPVETLCGILLHTRMIEDACDLTQKLLATQQRPMSLRTLLETLISVKSHVRALGGGDYSTKAHGFHFIPTGKAVPSPPSRSQPEDRKRFMEWLHSVGLSHLIYEEVGYTALSASLTKMAEKAPNGGTPWPDWMRVYVAPSVTMKALTEKQKASEQET